MEVVPDMATEPRPEGPLELFDGRILYFRRVVTRKLRAYVLGGGTIRFNVIHEESSENSVNLFSGEITLDFMITLHSWCVKRILRVN